MRGIVLPLAVALATAASPACAQDAGSAFGQPALDDSALAEMRGGFGLPGGLDVSVAVQSDTRVNGALVLRTVFVVERDVPSLTVFGRTGAAPETGGATGSAGSRASLTFSNQPVVLGGASEGLTELALTRNGASVSVSGGDVRIATAGASSQVILSQANLDIRHITGQAYGSVLANRGNDVTIDTVTNINIDLRNALPSNIGSTMFRIDALVADSAARMAR